MCLKSGKEVERTALGCFDDRWRKRVRVIDERVYGLSELLRSAG
jgi:hypothetical protein